MLPSKARQRSDSGSVLYKKKKFGLSSSRYLVITIKLADCVRFYYKRFSIGYCSIFGN